MSGLPRQRLVANGQRGRDTVGSRVSARSFLVLFRTTHARQLGSADVVTSDVASLRRRPSHLQGASDQMSMPQDS